MNLFRQLPLVLLMFNLTALSSEINTQILHTIDSIESDVFSYLGVKKLTTNSDLLKCHLEDDVMLRWKDRWNSSTGYFSNWKIIYGGLWDEATSEKKCYYTRMGSEGYFSVGRNIHRAIFSRRLGYVVYCFGSVKVQGYLGRDNITVGEFTSKTAYLWCGSGGFNEDTTTRQDLYYIDWSEDYAGEKAEFKRYFKRTGDLDDKFNAPLYTVF